MFEKVISLAFCLIVVSSSVVLANSDAIVIPNGDLRLKGTGSGVVFPDGSIQYKASVPLTLGAICGAIAAGGKELPGFCVNHNPVANAGDTQSVAVDDVVTLDGGASTDSDGDNLVYNWSFISKPTGSVANLLNSKTVNPSFTADNEGTYVLRLIVNDGVISSAPADVTVIASSTPNIPTGILNVIIH